MEYNYIPEPLLMFGKDNHYCPRRGISLYDVFDTTNPHRKTNVVLGVVGIQENIEQFNIWIEKCSGYIPAKVSKQPNLFVPFYGFNEESGFKSKFINEESNYRQISNGEIKEILKIKNKSEMTEKAVELFLHHIEFLSNNRNVEVVICLIPKSFENKIVKEKIQKLEDTIEETNDESIESENEFNFRRALKAKVMQFDKPVQLIKEMSLIGGKGRQDDATRAWNFCTAVYYKSNKTIPWRLLKEPNKPPVCYVGISFYKSRDKRTTQSSLAQMFDEYGNGVILRGSPVEKSKIDLQPHLNEDQANDLLCDALDEYKFIMDNYPARLVIHKSSNFSDDEFSGFEKATKKRSISKIDFITIQDSHIKFFRDSLYPPQRGSMYTPIDDTIILYTRGSVPYYQTYPGMYIPTPLNIKLARYDDSSLNICKDIISLTKMNWNNTQFDGKYPITLACARRVGEIMKYIPSEIKPNSRYAFYM